jgi:hypothetical protein
MRCPFHCLSLTVQELGLKKFTTCVSTPRGAITKRRCGTRNCSGLPRPKPLRLCLRLLTELFPFVPHLFFDCLKPVHPFQNLSHVEHCLCFYCLRNCDRQEADQRNPRHPGNQFGRHIHGFSLAPAMPEQVAQGGAITFGKFSDPLARRRCQRKRLTSALFGFKTAGVLF